MLGNQQKLTLLSFYEQAIPLTIVSVSGLIIIIQIVFTKFTSEKKRKEDKGTYIHFATKIKF